MAHYKSQSKMGYYPTPAHLIPLIAQNLHAPDPGNCRILDPCAGTGETLSLLGSQLGITGLYANELDAERAEACRETAQFGHGETAHDTARSVRLRLQEAAICPVRR